MIYSRLNVRAIEKLQLDKIITAFHCTHDAKAWGMIENLPAKTKQTLFEKVYGARIDAAFNQNQAPLNGEYFGLAVDSKDSKLLAEYLIPAIKKFLDTDPSARVGF